MKICVLTLALKKNYGGILQAYSLQKYLENKGHKVVTSDIKYCENSIGFKIRRKYRIFLFKFIDLRYRLNESIELKRNRSKRNYLNTTLLFIKKIISDKVNKSDKNNSIFERVDASSLREFVENNIKTIDLLEGKLRPSKKIAKQFDAIVVGSDQVWRSRLCDVPMYMLNFTKKINLKRLAYAASFGKADVNEYTSYTLKKTKKLIKNFDAISVREDSGVEICKNIFKVKATHVLDPTMLLNRDEYEKLIIQDSKDIVKSNGELFVYVLDENKEKKNIISYISKNKKMKPFSVLATKEKVEALRRKEKWVMPGISQWLKSFVDSKFVVTDSFHGTIFSILFNKPFITIINKQRGATRFYSLLKMFNLENRLVESVEGLDLVLEEDIDYNEVMTILNKKKIESESFLNDNLFKGKKNRL